MERRRVTAIIKPFRLDPVLEAIATLNSGLNADRPAKVSPGSLNTVLNSVSRIAHHDHLVIILSDFDGIDDATHRHLSGIAHHNDLVLGLVYDPSARGPQQRSRATIGDGEMQAEIDFGDDDIFDEISQVSGSRLERILRWQTEINLSILPLSASEETLPQLRKLMGASAPVRRVR